MKNLWCLLFLLPATLFSQQFPNINLTFGTYIDDQVEHKFTSNERVWNLNGEILDYSIDANDSRYVDTLSLNDEEIEKIISLLLKNEPLKSVKKELISDFLDKEGVSHEIRGVINFNSKVLEILIKSNGFSTADEDSDVKWLEELEQLFYEIIGNHR
jgi:hypothetical protein